jgi:hypothetical protein
LDFAASLTPFDGALFWTETVSVEPRPWPTTAFRCNNRQLKRDRVSLASVLYLEPGCPISRQHRAGMRIKNGKFCHRSGRQHRHSEKWASKFPERV